MYLPIAYTTCYSIAFAYFTDSANSLIQRKITVKDVSHFETTSMFRTLTGNGATGGPYSAWFVCVGY